MASYNKVILMGNLTRDPETRVTPNGATICKIGIAVNRTYYDSHTNERKEDVTFVDCDAFGKTAEAIGRYMSKGKCVLIDGRLRLDQWEDKQSGQQRSKLGVTIENCQFIGDRDASSQEDEPREPVQPRAAATRQSQPQGRQQFQQSQAPRRPAPPRMPQNDFNNDDVPF